MRNITEEDMEAAANLKRIWDTKAKPAGLTQRKAGEYMSIHQTLVGQYLRGKTALGTEALLRFAKLLDVSPTEIRPNFRYKGLLPGDLPPEAIEMSVAWMMLPDDLRAQIKGMLDALARRANQKTPAA